MELSYLYIHTHSLSYIYIKPGRIHIKTLSSYLLMMGFYFSLFFSIFPLCYNNCLLLFKSERKRFLSGWGGEQMQKRFSRKWYAQINSRGLFEIRLVKESESYSIMSYSLRPHGVHSPWVSPDQNTGVGSCPLLQGIFPGVASLETLSHYFL